jgi:hypothetical protein
VFHLVDIATSTGNVLQLQYSSDVFVVALSTGCKPGIQHLQQLQRHQTPVLVSSVCSLFAGTVNQSLPV